MIVIAERWFQLANRLFTMGHFIGAACERNFSIANPAFADYAEHFETTANDLWCRYPARPSLCPKARWIARSLEKPAIWLAQGMQRGHLNNRLFRAVHVGLDAEFSLERADFQKWSKQTYFLLVHGWSFRDAKSFNRHADIIRNYFLPLKVYRERISEELRKARQKCDILVGVHIRQGDYQTHLGGKYYYTTENYVRWMQQMVELFPGKKVGFWICSNVPQPAEKFITFRWYQGIGHLVMDLYSLAACDYLLGPPSTYSQWASFYGKKPLGILRSPEVPISNELFQVFDASMSHV